ncbi:MAG: hypothetical protein LBP65_00165 [Puniceicoccales bacterium]|jgi:hypothetical protein|nr:hypothetical protein [Puniceicoccales bacterium]
MALTPVNGNRYVIYVPDEGWMLFKYNGSSFESIDASGAALIVYRNFNASSSYGAGQLFYTPADLTESGLVLCALFQDNMIVNPSLSPQCGTSKLIIPRNSAEMQAILEDPLAMVLFSCVESVMPFVDCMATLIEAIHSAQLGAQRAMLNQSQKTAQVAQQVQEMVDKIHDSFFFKMMNSPACAIFFIVFAAVIMLLMAAATFFTGGLATGFFLAAIIIAVLVVIAAAALFGSAAGILNSDLQDLEDKFRTETGLDPAIEEAFEDLRAMVGTTAGLVVAAVVATAIGSMVAGYMAIKGPGGSYDRINKMNEQRAEDNQPALTKQEENSIHVGTAASGAGSTAGGAAGILEGVLTIAEGMYQLAMAPLIELHSIEKARITEWEAQSKYFGSIVKHVQEGLKNLWEYVEKMVSSQATLIRTLGDTSTTIARNISV